jgi:hypothetical protein
MALAEAISPLRGPLSLADKGVQAVRYLAQHPVFLAGIAAVVMMIKPGRWLFVLEKGWMMWRLLLAARQRLGNRGKISL